MRRLAAAILVVSLSFACTTLAQRRADTLRREREAEEVLYFPNERLLKSFTCGQSSVIADLLWLKCISYTSREFRGDFKFTLLDRMLGTITRLDPYFVDAYKWGGVFLAMLKRDNDASIELLKSGIDDNPRSWELPFEIARTYILNRHDGVMGAKWMALAASTGEPPQFVVDWAKNLQQKHNLGDIERDMWAQIIENTTDENMRETAKRRLIEVDLREVCRLLDGAVKAYRAKTGKAPESLDDFWTADSSDGRPVDPLGGTFFIDEKGDVQNTSLLDSQVEERLVFLRGSINRFKEETGATPPNLELMRERGYAIPTHPYHGREWQYDPATGEVK
ncbi:MAG: hypothetical protein HUU46_01510 [Candidatus Hydrogenedentes bacterium]|nr:hypothetical protein [Candidatus Hydrogenedentota bacterium]